ncbi:MAG TPA: amino acid permease [Bacteroidales bacterium]|nr:amino acid permease [Bacteroidales bacterium]
MKKFDSEVRLAREMSLLDVTLIGVGAMIGAGIFVLIGMAAGVAGPALILGFVLNGVVTLFTAMAYAELGSCFHDAGGGYLWVKEGLPKWNGFLAGWMSWFAHAVACSVYALGFGAYFAEVFKEVGIHMANWGYFSPEKILALGAAVLFAYINFRGASETGKVGNFVTLAKVTILLIFIAFGLNVIFNKPDWASAFTPFMPHGFGGVLSAMGLTFIAFEGYEVISQCSEEIKNPKKNIPKAIFFSLIIVVPIYILVGFVAIGAVTPGNLTPWDYLASHKEIALVEVAKTFFIGGGIMLLFGGIISTMSALNATIYSSSRVAYAMGRDKNFPSFFGKVHSKNFTPHWSILFSLIIIAIMAVSLPIQDVACAADIMFLLLFLQVNIAVITLRKKRPDLDRGFITPLFPWIPIIGIITKLFLAVFMFNYSPIAWVITIFWIGLGLFTFKMYASKREIEHIRKVRTLDQISKKEYSLLVYLSDQSSLESISQIAVAIAKKHNAKIIFLYIIELKEGKKLKSDIKLTDRVHELMQKAQSFAEESSISSKAIIKISHRISSGIYDTSIEEDCNFILMDRKKNSYFLERFFYSVIDSVLQKSTNEVAILHGEIKPEKIKNILIPFGGDIHTQLAAEIAPALKEFFNAEIRFGIVFSPKTSDEEKHNKTEQINNLLLENKISAKVVTIVDSDIVKGILKLSIDNDLLVMGGKTGDFIELLFSKSLVREITEQVEFPVLWLKEYEEREGFFFSLFKTHKK